MNSKTIPFLLTLIAVTFLSASIPVEELAYMQLSTDVWSTGTLGSRIELKFPDDDIVYFSITAYNRDNNETLILGENSIPLVMQGDTSAIVTNSGKMFSITRDAGSEMYKFTFAGLVDMYTGWMDSVAWSTHFEIPCENFTRSSNWPPFHHFAPLEVTEDSVVGEFIYLQPTRGIATAETGRNDTVELSLGDTLEYMYTDKAGVQFEIQELFVGLDEHSDTIPFVQIRFLQNDWVHTSIPATKTPAILEGRQDFKVISANGRIIREFNAEMKDMPSLLMKESLSPGIYIIKSPHHAHKFMIE